MKRVWSSFGHRFWQHLADLVFTHGATTYTCKIIIVHSAGYEGSNQILINFFLIRWNKNEIQTAYSNKVLFGFFVSVFLRHAERNYFILDNVITCG
jgi:hypothetical protein